MKKLTTTFARIIYAVPIGIFGLFHFMKAENMKGMVPGWLPGQIFWVYLTGLFLLAGAIGIAINKKGKLAAMLLAALIGSFILFVHVPGLVNEQTMQMSMMSLLKDMAIIGGALALAGSLPEE
ncbi:MAG: DoxX family protein [Spirochaetia bacterium]|nr:DoxX family protein [Spirochaetia bacterium]